MVLVLWRFFLKLKMPELRVLETAGVPISRRFCLKFNDVLGLRAFRALRYFKFHGLLF
jgi:hypothetical protein